ncbi:hypothetical protein DW2_04059 [Thioclava atlantica]|uniref:Uncharacterized protein n=1 Tax=Thioclava atlantica TaxID=1317124 RepID=A0A085U0F7_9RHOB|nr:hypothetical protein DW2_04059 [Thioclava atlantica]
MDRELVFEERFDAGIVPRGFRLASTVGTRHRRSLGRMAHRVVRSLPSNLWVSIGPSDFARKNLRGFFDRPHATGCPEVPPRENAA